MKSVGVFCGSSAGTRPEYVQIAQATGRLLAERGYELIYGGGHVGMMGHVADAALHAGGRVTGVITHALAAREVAHLQLTELHTVTTMHERKAMMAERSDAFLVLPGGIGTMEEFFEVWTWGQLGEHRKPFGLVNIAGYFDALIQFVNHMVAEQFLKPKHQQMLIVGAEPASVLDAFVKYEPPASDKWITASET